MANLGTLFFGADIDLTQLKNKINQGNQGILDALKMNYDPASYTQMVNDLKHRLASETFEIKIQTNSQQVAQQLQQTVNSISNSASTPKIDLSGLKGIPGMTRDIIDQRDRIRELTFEVEKLRNAWKHAQSTYGQNSRQAQIANNEYRAALRVLQEEKTAQFALTQTRERARLAQQELNREMREASRAAKQWNSDHLRLNTTLAGGIHISTQLGSALSSLFAIDAARQFLGQVIEIGGQLEKQRISIGAILGDVVKANHLFEQIKGLALKSPFGVVELDQYTKQLSAYGFQYNELFDMTKRLADISAGAGTDIGRLTLALGHVRSATYLTGITLRQFSMNNIPMLKMLAEYYTELEGKIVSTAEVQQRISKRQVSYQDVIEQIKRLTNEGGMFYNMQEKISDSLAAKFKNLKDAMDIMYGEIAESSFGSFMKDMATELTAMTRHWKEIGAIIGIASGAFMLSKLRIGAATISMQGNTAATVKQIMADKQLIANKLKAAQAYRTLTSQEQIQIMASNSLTVADLKQAMATNNLTKEDVLRLVALKKLKVAQAMHLVGINGITAAEIRAAAAAGKWRTALAGLQMSLKNAFMGIGAGTWATIGAMVGMELYMAYNGWVERIEGKAKEMTDVIKSRVIDLQKQQKILDNNGQPKDLAETKARVDEMKQVLANSEAYTKTLDEQLKNTTDINKQYTILTQAIDSAVEKNKRMLDYQEQIAEMIKHSSGDFESTSYSENLRWFFNDDITKNMSQTLDAYKDLRTVIDTAWEYKDAIKNVIEEMEKSGEISEDFAERLKNAPFEEQLRLLANSSYWSTITKKVAESDVGFLKFADRIKEAADGVSERWDEIANDDIPRMMEILVKNFDGDEKKMREWALNNIDDFKMMLDGINDQLGVKEPAIRKKLKRMFYDYVRFSELEKGMAEGAEIGASILGNTNLEKLLGEDELADLDADAGEGGKKGGASKDKILEAWKNRYDALKTYYDEVQKYVALGYDVKSAMKKVKDLGLGDGSLFKGMEASKENYANLLRQLLSETDANTTQRAKLQRDIKSALGDFDRDGTKEQMDRNVAIMKDYIKVMDAQWKLYRDVMNKTGNREFASLAFNDGVMWDEVSRKLLEEFRTKGKEKGVIPVNFEWRMNEKDMEDALRDADGIVQKDMVELAKEIQKIIRGNYTNFIKESAEAYSKSLSAQEKLNELIRKRTELEEQASRDNNDDVAIQKGYQTQIESLNRQIADQQWAAFKEVNDWGKVFGNLDKVSTDTLQTMLDKLQEVAPKINDSVESTKALYEAIDKIDKVMADRNPLLAFGNASRKANMAALMRKEAKQFRSEGYMAAADEREKEAADLEREAMEDFGNVMDGLTNKFKAVQDALSPVITLFETLGDEGLANFFKMGSDAFGAASQMGNGAAALFGASAGPWGAAIGAGLSIVSSLFAMHDESLQKEIEASEARQKEMENLTKNLETSLQRTLGGIYSLRAKESELSTLDNGGRQKIFGDYYRNYRSEDTKQAVEEAKQTKTYYDATYASLLAQRDELQHQMQMEEDKKKSDSNKIADYKQQLAEMQDEIENFAKDMAKALWDIDVKDWAKSLTETIVDAWQKGEDAVDAYKNKVKEMMLELTTNILSQKVMERMLEDVGLDKLITDLMASTKGELDIDAVAQIADKLNEAGDLGSNIITQILDKMESSGYISKDEETAKSSVGTSIKGITEQTADLLAAYVNSIRADLSVNRAMIATYYPQFLTVITQVSVLSQTQVTLQQQIASNTMRNADAADRIYDILHRVSPDGTSIRVK